MQGGSKRERPPSRRGATQRRAIGARGGRGRRATCSPRGAGGKCLRAAGWSAFQCSRNERRARGGGVQGGWHPAAALDELVECARRPPGDIEKVAWQSSLCLEGCMLGAVLQGWLVLGQQHCLGRHERECCAAEGMQCHATWYTLGTWPMERGQR